MTAWNCSRRILTFSMYTIVLFLTTCATAFGNFYPIGGDSLTKTDRAARSEVMVQIAAKLDEMVKSGQAAIDACEVSINQTIDECNACRANLCQPKPPLDQRILITLSTGANAAIVSISKVTDDAGKWFQKSGTELGDRAGNFASTLGKTANSVGDALEGAGNFVLNGLSDGFKDLGSKFAKAGDTLNKAVLSPSLDGIKIGFKSLEKELGSALSGIENSFKSVGNFFEGVGSDVNNFFNGLGRKRRSIVALVRNRRCVNSCPVCDKLDNSKYTESQILGEVCGTTFVNNQEQALKDITWLEVSFNSTRDNTLIMEVKFDSTTFDFATQTADIAKYVAKAGGLATNAANEQDFPKPPKFSMGSNDQNGKAIGADYFLLAWNGKIQS